ncbi:MAG: hypothetical protein ACD_39C00891G0001 [uncultured bacterium]|nr:MAG: hypothetical protein ACD_39C00891G0001 [uncultured bacterium]
MKNFLGFAFLVGTAVLASLWIEISEQKAQSIEQSRARQMLIECFAGLDLQRIIEQNADYLEELEAGYDVENRRFFIEQPIAGSQYHDAGLLILISYPRPDEAEICLYAPEHLSWQWLHSRIRHTASCINAPLVFEPTQHPDDIVPYKLSVARPEFLVQQSL